MEKTGISARISWTGGEARVDDLEIDEGLLMTFGEEGYLPALTAYLAEIETRATGRVSISSGRSGYRMLLARLGYEARDGAMVKDARAPRKDPSPAAATFDSISASTFGEESRILMADGTRRMVAQIDVGDRVAHGDVVTAIMRGRHRDIVDIGPILCGGASVVRHAGRWIRARDHPEARRTWFPDGMEGVTLATRTHVFEVNGVIFADFHETEAHRLEMLAFSDQALEIMNAADGGSRV